jgi:HTH-type transcriptional regulator, quorum sensing regulator NprR
MNIGVIIRGYRKYRQLTQEELASGICSISHLSKIENGSKEYNEETISLLFKRLNIDMYQVQKERSFFMKLVDDFYKTIVYQDVESAKHKYSLINSNKEKLVLFGLNNLFEILSFRYYMFLEDRDKYVVIKKNLQNETDKFSQEENILFSYFNAIFYILTGNFKEALALFTQLLDRPILHYGDFYYHLALTMSFTNNPGAAILYSNKALEQYDLYNNFTRKLHTQMILAINYQRIGALKESEHYYELLLTNSTRVNDVKNIASNSHNLSILKMAQQKDEEAIQLLQKSIQAAKEAQISYLPSLCQLADIYILNDDIQLALQLMKQIISKAKEEGNKKTEIKYIFKYNYISLTIDKFAEYIQETGFSRLECLNLFEDMVTYSNYLIAYYQEKRDVEKKISFLEKANLALHNLTLINTEV